MDIGSGLTIETRNVNGKLQAGIFLSHNGKNARNKTKPKYPIRSRVEPDKKPKTRSNQTGQEAVKNVISKSQDLKQQQQKLRKERTGSAKNLPPNAKKMNIAGDKAGRNGTQQMAPNDPQGPEKTKTVKNTNPKIPGGTQPKRGVTKPKGKENSAALPQQDPTPSQDADTRFVTLTQGQLNTILSLVKSKNEVDVSEVLEEKDDLELGSKVNTNDKNEEEKDGEKTETQEGDKDTGSRPSSKKSSKGESIGNLLKKSGKKDTKNDVESPKTGENLSRESSNIQNEDIEPGRRSQENLPAAIRSSFFIGEGAPREHAFSATKRAEQQRWREELDKQRTEQREKKVREKDIRSKAEDVDSWTRHFDTMLPTKNSPRKNENLTQSVEFPPQNTTGSRSNNPTRPIEVLSDQLLNPGGNINTNQAILSENAPFPSAGGNNGTLRQSNDFSGDTDFVSTMTNNDVPQRSSYLRTMTSLLDPAQIEALEVKRKKQDEHRRAIEAQVEERRRKKEEEEQRQRRFEAEEDSRLAAERDSLVQKTELDKQRHQVQENMREQKTRELYQQMKNAEESALRDKLAKREQILKNRGHDTTRLERAHQMTLEMSHKVAVQQPLAQTSQTSLASNSTIMPTLQLPQDGYVSNNVTPRQVIGVVGQSVPVAVTAQTEQGPIKLEISLNQKRASELVECGMQTEERIGDPRSLNPPGFDSDAETEYLQLPQKRRNTRPNEREKKERNVRLQNFEKNLDRQYDRHSRADRNIAGAQARPKKNGPRPKWGVAEKTKNFVPASQRYTKEQQRHDAVIRKRAEQHAIGDAERSRVTSQSPTKYPSEPRSKSPVIPAVRNRPKKEAQKRQTNVRTTLRDRPSSGIYATTETAKYRSEKHSRDSPVPETKDFVQYRRTMDVLNPNQPQSRPETGPMESRTEFVQRHDRPIPAAHGDGDPLLNPEILRQHERQEQILREISILRQGLLIKQREVASYPAAMTHSMAVLPPTGAAPTSLILAGGGNLPERTNDTPVM